MLERFDGATIVPMTVAKGHARVVLVLPEDTVSDLRVLADLDRRKLSTYLVVELERLTEDVRSRRLRVAAAADRAAAEAAARADKAAAKAAESLRRRRGAVPCPVCGGPVWGESCKRCSVNPDDPCCRCGRRWAECECARVCEVCERPAVPASSSAPRCLERTCENFVDP